MFLGSYLYLVEEYNIMLPDLAMDTILGFLDGGSFLNLVCAQLLGGNLELRPGGALRVGFSDYLNRRCAAALDFQRVFRGWIHGRILFQRAVDPSSNVACQYWEEDYAMPGESSYRVKWSMNFCEDEGLRDY